MKIALQVEEQAGALPKEHDNRYTASGKEQHVQGGKPRLHGTARCR